VNPKEFSTQLAHKYKYHKKEYDVDKFKQL
jgi:hypothetical protein